MQKAKKGGRERCPDKIKNWSENELKMNAYLVWAWKNSFFFAKHYWFWLSLEVNMEIWKVVNEIVMNENVMNVIVMMLMVIESFVF